MNSTLRQKCAVDVVGGITGNSSDHVGRIWLFSCMLDPVFYKDKRLYIHFTYVLEINHHLLVACEITLHDTDEKQQSIYTTYYSSLYGCSIFIG